MPAVIDEHTQFMDASGNPYASGSIYIGTAGQDPVANAITIYSDAALSSTLANPQTLDSFGRPTNKIFVPGEYSIQVNDSSDVQRYQNLNAGQFTTLKPQFQADKDSTDQTALTTGLFTKITFSQERTGDPSFSTSTSRWTPGKIGFATITAQVWATVWVDGSRGAISIYKNGVEHRTVTESRPGTDNQCFSITIKDECSATDYYELYFWHNTGADRIVSGATTETLFCGVIDSLLYPQ